MKRDTWIPYTNDLRVNSPHWLNTLDWWIGTLMCKIGLHTDKQSDDCWYCQRRWR